MSNYDQIIKEIPDTLTHANWSLASRKIRVTECGWISLIQMGPVRAGHISFNSSIETEHDRSSVPADQVLNNQQ